MQFFLTAGTPISDQIKIIANPVLHPLCQRRFFFRKSAFAIFPDQTVPEPRRFRCGILRLLFFIFQHGLEYFFIRNAYPYLIKPKIFLTKRRLDIKRIQNLCKQLVQLRIVLLHI